MARTLYAARSTTRAYLEIHEGDTMTSNLQNPDEQFYKIDDSETNTVKQRRINNGI